MKLAAIFSALGITMLVYNVPRLRRRPSDYGQCTCNQSRLVLWARDLARGDGLGVARGVFASGVRLSEQYRPNAQSQFGKPIEVLSAPAQRPP